MSAAGESNQPPAVAEMWDLAMTESKLKAADELWQNASIEGAIASYQEVLDHLPEECAPFRSLVILRLAHAEWAAGHRASCLEALRLLNALDYIPEHHVLAASELASIVATGINPSHQPTPLPPLHGVITSIFVSADGPIQTLSDAVTRSRAIREASSGGAVEIVLAAGTYQQTETIVLGEKDSGLIIRSQDRLNPATLTGGVVLKTWDKVSDQEVLEQLPEVVRDRVLVCDLGLHGVTSLGELVFGGFSSQRVPGGATRFKVFPVPEFFHRGEPQVLARWPNDRMTKLPVIEPPPQPDPRYARWALEKELWLYGYWKWDWADAYEKVAHIEPSGRIILAPPVNGYGFELNQGFALNALCELDVPGEWHLDTKHNRIHFLPPENFRPDQAILSCFGTVIAAENCAALQIRDVRVTYARGDAMTFVDCDSLVLAGVDIQDCSGTGLRIRGGSHHLIHSCVIDSMGQGGIDFLSGDWQKLLSGHSIIENNRISRLSRIDRTYTPGILLQGMGINVRNNSFVDIPSSAIRVEACDARIEMNYFHHCVYESGDQGVIDMWANPLYRGNVIRWNDFDRIVNTSGASYGAAAIRLDDFISGFMISENVFRTGSSSGFGSVQFNMGTDSYVEGNIIVGWHAAFSGWSLGGDDWKTRVTSHDNSRRVLEETDWQSEAWRKKYPMVRDLLRGDDNHNFLVDNQLLGPGSWGKVDRSISFANTVAVPDFQGETLELLKPLIVPWHMIPIDTIGCYEQ